ncbi:MAG: alpha/beta hydrolase [Myxococcales bacterium]|nr:alpha/beta hydrolase [Myxococcales bacterium]
MPRLLLVHGSAADHSTWSIQLAGPLREHFVLDAYDRGSGSVEELADEAGARVPSGEPTIAIGSSFGAVVTLELLRRHPGRIAGAVLIEPPMAASDDGPAAPAGFLAELDRIAEADGGPAAAERFLRTVLGEAAYARMPKAFQDRSKAKWDAIRADSVALIGYRPRYAELRAITTPVQLVGGEKSAAYFRPTLDALFAHLPDARLEILRGAGHMLHAEAHRAFNDVVLRFAKDLGVW